MSRRPIDDGDRDFIMAHGRRGLELLKHYEIPEPGKVSAAKIGRALDAWRSDSSPYRDEEVEVVRALGCLLGILLEQSGVASWLVVDDEFGTALALRHEKSSTLLYPLDVVSKRTDEPNAGKELESVFDVFSQGLS